MPLRSGDPFTDCPWAGKRFFKDGGQKTTLTLTEVSANGAGVVMLTYQPPAKDAEASAANEQE